MEIFLLILVILAIALFIAGLYLGISHGVNRTYDIVFDAMKQAHVNENTIKIIEEIIEIKVDKLNKE